MNSIPANFIRCSACKTGLEELPSGDGAFSCPSCRAGYAVVNGIVDLAPDLEIDSSLWSDSPIDSSAWYNQPGTSPLYSRIYEWFRQGRLGRVVLGHWFHEELAIMRSALDLQGDERMLDVASGCGLWARHIASSLPSGHLFALDADIRALQYPALITRLQAIPNITQVHADGRVLPFEDGCFDAVMCQGAVHVFPERSRVLAEISRVLKPGGRFVAATMLRGEGRMSRLKTWLHKRLLHSQDFTRGELALELEKAGLSEPASHYAKGIWQIMSAVKPS